MLQSEAQRRTIFKSSVGLLMLVLTGCASVLPEPDPAPPVVAQQIIEPLPEPGTVSPHVAVLLSESLPAYKNVSTELVAYLEDYKVYDLSDGRSSTRETFAEIDESDAELVVAIGLYAAKLAKSFATVPVIFGQVFNVNDSDLISDEMKGVAVLPPLELQAEAWRGMDPNLRNIGAILGAGHEDLIVEAEQAMKIQGFIFQYVVVKSDRETLYQFNRMVPDIDGFLLFPDNRILSPAVLTDILKVAARHQVQVAAFSELLLAHGAAFSANSVAADIAGKIAFALNEILDGDIDEIADLAPLSEIRIEVNPAMAQRYGLDLGGVEIGDSVADAQ
jgi:ABC-type uncharacterized transport system substrate-binding protein